MFCGCYLGLQVYKVIYNVKLGIIYYFDIDFVSFGVDWYDFCFFGSQFESNVFKFFFNNEKQGVSLFYRVRED